MGLIRKPQNRAQLERMLGKFVDACGWSLAVFAGFFGGVATGAGGPLAILVIFGIAVFAIFTFFGAFLAGYSMGHHVRSGFIQELRRLRQERNPRHARTPACVVGRRAPCRDAVCDCGHHCGRHGLVVGGSANLKPEGCEKPNMLDRCVLCDCTGWRQS